VPASARGDTLAVLRMAGRVARKGSMRRGREPVSGASRRQEHRDGRRHTTESLRKPTTLQCTASFTQITHACLKMCAGRLFCHRLGVCLASSGQTFPPSRYILLCGMLAPAHEHYYPFFQCTPLLVRANADSLTVVHASFSDRAVGPRGMSEIDSLFSALGETGDVDAGERRTWNRQSGAS
jgi:hypothetical protein